MRHSQSLLVFSHHEQALASDMFCEVDRVDGEGTLEIARGPVQFDHQPVTTTRARQAFEHTEHVLLEIGLEWDQIGALKDRRIVA